MNSRIKISDIHDGSSNTFLIGESIHQGWDMLWSSSFKTSDIAVPFNIAGANIQINTLTGGHDASLNPYWNVSRSFGSFHPGGCHFAFADGHIQFFFETVDLHVYQNLGNRNDGETLDGGF